MQIAQTIKTPAEKLAYEIAQILETDKERAKVALLAAVKEFNLTVGEASIVVDIAKKMVAGRKWKKGE